MELKTTTQKLKFIIEAGMLPSNSKPLFDPLVLIFQKDQVLNKQNHANILAVHNTFSPKFFETYSPGDTGEIPVPFLILNRLKNGFSSGAVTMKLEKNTFSLDDDHDHYDRPIDSFEAINFPTSMKKTEYGWFPESFTPEFAVILDSGFLDLPSANTYTFDYKAKKFTVSAPKDGNFIRKLEPKTLIESKPIHKLVDSEYINLVISHLKGDIHIGFQGSIILLSNITKNENGEELYAQTYLIAGMQEESK